MFDTHSLAAYSQIVSVVSQDATTLIVTVRTGEGALFGIPQQVTIWPKQAAHPLITNMMVGKLIGINGDQLTIDITSANREGSNVRTALVGDQIMNSITPKTIKDIEANIIPLLVVL